MKKCDIWQTATAFCLSAEQVERLFSSRIQAILGRGISAHFASDIDYWEIRLTPPPTPSEIEILFSHGQADAEDRAEHSIYKDAVRDLSARFSVKLISDDFPVPVYSASPTEHGLCFFAEFHPFEKVYGEAGSTHGVI